MAKQYVIKDSEAQEMIKRAMEEGMLLWIHCKAWGNKKKVARELLEEKFQKDAERIRAVQTLIDSEPVKAITKLQDEAKKTALRYSMPWFHSGIYWIPQDKVEEVDKVLTECRKKIKEEAVPNLKREYPALVKKAKKEHPKLYQPEHFPSVDSFDQRFDLQWGWQKVLPPMNGKVSVLSKEVVDRENKKWQEMLKEVGEEFVQATRESLLELLKRLRDKLSDPEAKFKDSTVEKPKEFLEQLASVKFPFEDKPLKELLADVRDILDGVYGSDLRSDKDYRKAMGEVMSDVVKSFKELPVVKVERFVDF